jgi:hypothetical protein
VIWLHGFGIVGVLIILYNIAVAGSLLAALYGASLVWVALTGLGEEPAHPDGSDTW